jgi:hypothetical protein
VTATGPQKASLSDPMQWGALWGGIFQTDPCKLRYALIVTLKARNADLEIYTPVRTSIGLPVPVLVETPV